MKIYTTPVKNSIPVIIDCYNKGEIVEQQAWVVMNDE